ncbi:MAG: hypothetical protein JKY94_02400 [Rhodobacteraceae bacterium]|nr:hypothetical protein [Paracoccaceae bacterium]
MNRLEKMAEANADKYGYVGRQYVRLDGRANEGIVSSPVVNTGNNPDNPNAPGYYGNNEPYSGEAPSSGGSYSDYSGAGSSNGSSSGSNTGGGYDHPGSGTTSGDFTPSGGEWEGGNGDQGHGTPEPGMPEDPDFTGYQPIILDLDGDGIQITELSKSTVFVDATGDGLQNQTAWAGAGNGVLFYDPDDTGEITDQRQYVFTEWDPTATSDIEVLWSVFDSNCDGVFDANDDECSNFKMMA